MCGPIATGVQADDAPPAAADVYREHCASCHGETRLGGSGPALLPENLGRLKRDAARAAVRDGKIATQMPAFGDVLDAAQIDAVVDLIYRAPDVEPTWGAAQIRASHVVHANAADIPAVPTHDADPLNLFVVVEGGDHHVTILDGDRFEPLDRFPTRFALHGGAKFSPDGRFTYLVSRDGWLVKYDLWSLAKVAEIRVGLNSRNVATSSDGRYAVVGNVLPHSLVLLDAADLSLLEVIAVAGADGNSSRVSAVYNAPPRESFVVALRDVPEAWEIPYAPRLAPRRIPLDDYLDDFMFDQDYTVILGAARDGKSGRVVDIDDGSVVAPLALEGMPHLGSGISWKSGDTRLFATPHLKAAQISIIETATWKTVKTLPTLGPGFFMRSHAATPYAWADVYFGPDRDVMYVIDKRRLEFVRTLRLAPGKTVAHAEFTRDGSHVLISVMEQDGALLVLDAATFAEVKRLPMNRPVGKYNVHNKIRYEEGTSH